ncbi:hypothetical protein [Vibrio cyclitrophicus]|uniref:hypothetical protein n=1 Tax=Vibrio cyclitrophicus TaxID=47951 RepID=UPI000C840E78|nr:hypothetical protein [Vibrio cyclitrophicus]PME40381.1 hypothetical protein BCV36_21270 [Vibrio cyclitrophicus]PME57886.1 hypothetical protein BCV37_22085 [Vibrio cyclitrophicus]
MELARQFIECGISISLSLFNFSAFCHEYPKLSEAPNATAYHQTIEHSHVYPVSKHANNILWLYYKDMKLKNEWLDKDQILNENGFYHAIRSFSGEKFGLLWRHENRKSQKQVVGGADIDHQLNTVKRETVPLSSIHSPWHDNKYTVKYPTPNTTYSISYMEGKRFEGKHIAFPVHRVGFFFGRSGLDLDRNSLVFSLNAHFIGSQDGTLESTTLQQDNLALLTIIAVPFSIGDLKKMMSEHDASEQCYDSSLLILHHRNDV